MRCKVCGRELKEDSKFCDWCGSEVQEEKPERNKRSFNTSLLLSGLFLSLLISIIISGSAAAFGVPLLFGGLFLPFFWRVKKVPKAHSQVSNHDKNS